DKSNVLSALIAKNQYMKADAEIDAWLKDQPASAEPWYFKALIHQKTGSASQAIQCFNKAIQCRPDFEEACLDMATLLEDLGEDALAAKTYEHWLKIVFLAHEKPPASADSNAAAAKEWFEKGIACYRAGDLQNAVPAFQKATSLAPGVPEAWSNLGMALF